MKKRIAVIGAGISGLTCAYELQKAGHEVVVFEKNTQVGGRMSSRSKDGFVFDLGADHLCEWYTEMKKYCVEFGIPWGKMHFMAYGIMIDGQIVPQAQAIKKLGGLKLAMQYLALPQLNNDFFNLSNFCEYDNDNTYDYFKKHIGQKAADYLADGFSSTYQFHRATEISKGAMFGIMHSLKTAAKNWDLHRTQGGMQALPNAFAKNLNIKLNSAVQKIIASGDHSMVDNEPFDQVVFASTATATAAIYQNPTPAQANILKQARYASSISIAFRVPKSLLPEIAIVWVPYIESQKITGFVNEAMKGPELVNDHEALLCTWLHEDFAKSIMTLSDEEIFAHAKSELLRICPWISDLSQLQNHDLQRWPEAMPKFYPGYLKTVKNFHEHGQGEQNVYFCGDYLNSLWTEGALRGGKRTAEQIINN